MPLDLTLVVGGLTILLAGAWLTVRAASTLAASFGMSPVIIGATVVAFGTSAPEFVVSLTAASRDSPGIAIGNVLGSNVANVALVLGVAAAVQPVSVHWRLLRWELPVLVVGTIALLAFAADGTVNQWEGALMFSGLVLFVGLSLRLFTENAVGASRESRATASAGSDRRWRLRTKEALYLALGLVAITLGANTGVRGAVNLASDLGMTETAIGVTIVAVGTSLPEVATSAVAAYRREHEIAIANVIGSNIFNLLGVAGAVAGIFTLQVSGNLYKFEMVALALSTAVLVPLVFTGARITRRDGFVLLALYAVFIAVALARA